MQDVQFGTHHLNFGDQFSRLGLIYLFLAGAEDQPLGRVFQLKAKLADKIVANILLSIDHLADEALINADDASQTQLPAMLFDYYF